MPQTVLADPTDYGNEPGTGPLRPGGESQGEPRSKDDLPSTRSPLSDTQVGAVELVRDLWGGTERVRAAGQVYLPKAPGEKQQLYSTRLARSVFHNFFRRTIDGLVGLIFRVDPVLADDVPEPIVQHWENIDLAGTHGDVFLRDIAADAMTAGHAAILIDYPRTDGDQSRADEMAGNIRPYWIAICKEDIMSWRSAVVDGVTVLQQIVLRERMWVPKGVYGSAEQTRYRVLYRGENGVVGWRLEEVTENKTVVVHDEGVYRNQTEIPIVEVTTSGEKSLFESDPPLLDVAYLNIAHYQTWSDYIYAIHKTNVPVFVTTGLDLRDPDGNPTELIIGPNNGVMIPDPSGDAKYVAHSGQSLDSTKQALDDLKSDIGSLGLAMLAPQKRAAETAEAKRLDKSSSDSALAVSSRALQDAVERALGFHANYLRLDGGGQVKINRDFEGSVMEPAVMSAYAELGQKIGLPVDVIIRELQAGGRIGDDVDLDELELRMMAGMAAAEADRAERDADNYEEPEPE